MDFRKSVLLEALLIFVFLFQDIFLIKLICVTFIVTSQQLSCLILDG